MKAFMSTRRITKHQQPRRMDDFMKIDTSKLYDQFLAFPEHVQILISILVCGLSINGILWVVL